MSDAWRVELDRLRSDFKKLPDNLHHLLVEMDVRHRLGRGEKYAPATEDQDDFDPDCQYQIGTPPLKYWLSHPELEEVRSLSCGMMTGAFRLMKRHFFQEACPWCYDGRDRRHIFHGVRDSWDQYRSLATEAAIIIWRAFPTVKDLLPEFDEGPWFNPTGSPLYYTTPEQYWTLGLHRLAWRKLSGSSLWAERFTWGTGLLLSLDSTETLAREELRLISFDPTIRRERSDDGLRRASLKLDHSRFNLELVEKNLAVSQNHELVNHILSRVHRLEREVEINRDCACARGIRRKHGERFAGPLDFFFSALTEDPYQGPGPLSSRSVLAIDLILDLTSSVNYILLSPPHAPPPIPVLPRSSSPTTPADSGAGEKADSRAPSFSTHEPVRPASVEGRSSQQPEDSTLPSRRPTPPDELDHKMREAIDSKGIASTNKVADLAPSSPSPRLRSNPIPMDELNILVRESLETNPSASCREIAEAIGVSASRVCGTPAWKARQEAKPLKQSGRKAKRLPLSPRMLAIREGKDLDPSEITEARDLAERKYLEHASPDERAKYLEMSPLDRITALGLFADQLEDDGSCRALT